MVRWRGRLERAERRAAALKATDDASGPFKHLRRAERMRTAFLEAWQTFVTNLGEGPMGDLFRDLSLAEAVLFLQDCPQDLREHLSHDGIPGLDQVGVAFDDWRDAFDATGTWRCRACGAVVWEGTNPEPHHLPVLERHLQERHGAPPLSTTTRAILAAFERPGRQPRRCSPGSAAGGQLPSDR